MFQKRIRIAHIAGCFSGGIGTYMCHVLPRLVEHGLDVTLMVSLLRRCPDAFRKIALLERGGVAVERISMTRAITPFQDLRVFLTLLRRLSERRFDMVHTHCSKAGVLGRLAALAAGSARVHSPHCFAFLRCGTPLEGRVYLSLERVLGRFTTVLAAVGHDEAAVALSHGVVPAARCVPVANGLTFDAAARDRTDSMRNVLRPSSVEVPAGTHVVSTVCRLVDYKGIIRFLQAAQMLKTSNALCLVAGEGELRGTAEDFVRNHHLGGKVRFLGHVLDIESVYGVSDVVVLCSDAEGMPYTLLEAMRAQCPVVATDVAGNREVIAHGRTGYLVPPAAAQIAQAIDELLADDGKRRDLAGRAYESVRCKHTLERQVEQLVEIYHRVLLEGNVSERCIGSANCPS